MRRFSDSILFAVLFLIDVIALALVLLFRGVETGVPYRIAPLGIGGIVVVAAPALFIAMLLALGRCLTRTPPRHFYTWATVSSLISTIVMAIANISTEVLGIQVGFSWMAWFFGILTLAFVIALIISCTGGIPDENTTDHESQGRDETSDKSRENSRNHQHFGSSHDSARQHDVNQPAPPSAASAHEGSTANTSDHSNPNQPHRQQEEDPFQ